MKNTHYLNQTQLTPPVSCVFIYYCSPHVTKLLKEIAKDVPITFSSGTDEGEIGSSFGKISEAAASNEANDILAFYDLGSAKMTLNMVKDFSDKTFISLIQPCLKGLIQQRHLHKVKPNSIRF